MCSSDLKKIAARKLLRELSREDGGPGVPTALYLLAEDAIETRKTDDAVFFYNLLREGYPSAVGLGALIEAMTGMSTPDAANTQAEEITGTYYSVKVGVFSVEENAKKLAEEFRQYGKPVDVFFWRPFYWGWELSSGPSSADSPLFLRSRYSDSLP